MPDNDPLLQALERIDRLQNGVQKIWEKIPIPEAYRGILVSWLSLEIVLLGTVSSFVGLGGVAKSPWFLIPTVILTSLHGLALVGAFCAARKPARTAVAVSETCRVAGCPNKPTVLGFCPAHAARGRGCYRLLENYKEDDYEWFFGRGEAVAEVLGAVDGHPLTLLVGESGVGKSSLLRAGLNHLLREQGDHRVDPIYINCRDVVGDPVAYFDRVLEAIAPGLPVLVELDQFEQLFGHFPDEARRIVDWIKGQLAKGRRILISMRRDYVDDIDAYQADLPDIFRNRVRLLRFTAPQATDVMAKSAGYASVNFPDDLKAKIVEDLAEEPTAAATAARISPAELQIVCSRLVAGTSDVTLNDYRKRGGRTGLLEEFLLDTIDRFPTGDRQVVRHVLFELARRSPTISQRVDVPTLARTAPQPDRVGLVLDRLDELGFVNLRKSTSNGAATYELTHEYLIPLIRRFVHETDLEYYKCRTYFDQMQLDYRDGVTPPLARLLRVSLRLRDNLTEPERAALGAMWKRSFYRRMMPAAMVGVVLIAAGLVFRHQMRHRHYFAPNSAARIQIELPGKDFVDNTSIREQIPIDVYRGVPWLPLITEPVWETGYFLDELSPDGFEALAAFPAVPDEGRAFERILEPLLVDAVTRAEILVNTGRGPEAPGVLVKGMEASSRFEGPTPRLPGAGSARDEGRGPDPAGPFPE